MKLKHYNIFTGNYGISNIITTSPTNFTYFYDHNIGTGYYDFVKCKNHKISGNSILIYTGKSRKDNFLMLITSNIILFHTIFSFPNPFK